VQATEDTESARAPSAARREEAGIVLVVELSIITQIQSVTRTAIQDNWWLGSRVYYLTGERKGKPM
jgi:hypothetical protein